MLVGVVLLNSTGLEAPEDLVGECTLRLLCVLPVDGLLLAWCLLEMEMLLVITAVFIIYFMIANSRGVIKDFFIRFFKQL